MKLEDPLVPKAMPAGSALSYALLFTPEEDRDAVGAVLAFRGEIAEAIRRPKDTAVVKVRLAWWQEETLRLVMGQPNHPVSKALLPAVRRHSIPVEAMRDVVEAAAAELEGQAFENVAALRDHGRRGAGAVQELVARILAGEPEAFTDDEAEYARRLGGALRMTDAIREVRQDAALDRCFLPRDLMAGASVTAADLRAGSVSPGLSDVLQALHSAALDELNGAVALLERPVARRQRTGLVLAALCARLLKRLARERFSVAHQRIELKPATKLWGSPARRGHGGAPRPP